MRFDFLDVFQPHMIKVSQNQDSWRQRHYTIARDETVAHTLALVYDGEGALELNGTRYELKRGALFYVPVKSRMRLSTQEANLLKYHSVLFHYGTLRWEGEQGIWSNTNLIPLPLPDIVFFEEDPLFLRSFRLLQDFWLQHRDGDVWLCKKKFKHLLELIIRKKAEAPGNTQHNWALIEQAIVHFREHLSEPFERNALAKSLHLSPDYFSVLFKQYTGYTPSQFLIRLRIERAKQLLKDTGLTVTRIATEVGYDDALYFSRVFVKNTGVSPKNYRKI